MPRIRSVTDERNLMGGAAPAYAIDAPGEQNATFAVPRAKWGHGAIAGDGLDFFTLGRVAPGRYALTVEPYAWDPSRPADDPGASFAVETEAPYETVAWAGVGTHVVTFELARPTVLHLRVRNAFTDDGIENDHLQYRFKYEQIGPPAWHVVDDRSATLDPGERALTLTGAADVAGTGNGAANRIRGNDGDNVLTGLGGADRLFGAGGADALHGGTGDDRLSGGAGRDLLTGGRGADRFVFRSPEESSREAGPDLIADFECGLDRIDLSALAPADDALRFVGAAGFTGAPGEVRLSKRGLAADLDGDGRADFAVHVLADGTLGPGDLLL